MNLSQAQVKEMVETMTPEQIKTWVQEQGFLIWKENNCRGTMEWATGTGKSRVALLAAHAELQSDPNAHIVLATVTETMRDTDWPNEMRLCGLDYLIDKITRVCWVSLNKLKFVRDVSLFIGDEIHHLTVKAYRFFERGFKVFKIMGLSATLPDGIYPEDIAKRALIDSIAPSISQIPLELAIELRLVADFKVTVLLVDLDDRDPYIESGFKSAPVMRTERGHYDFISQQMRSAMVRVKLDKRKEGMQFQWITKRVQFLSNLRQKNILAREIMGYVLKDNRTLIFCGSIAQSVDLCGEQVYNSQTNDEQLKRFQNLEIPYLGVVQALNEGKNVNMLDQILVVQLNSKELNIIQRIGRTVRWREGHVAEVIILVARNTVDEKWYREAFSSFAKHRIKEHYVKPTTAAKA